VFKHPANWHPPFLSVEIDEDIFNNTTTVYEILLRRGGISMIDPRYQADVPKYSVVGVWASSFNGSKYEMGARAKHLMGDWVLLPATPTGHYWYDD
jgi:hypothetical protein